MKPEFVDNRELRLVDALRGHLDWRTGAYKEPAELAIATGYFNPEGFALIAEQLAQTRRVRLLLGAEPVPPPAIQPRSPGDPSGPRLEARRLQTALDLTASGLKKDRDLLPYSSRSDRALRGLLDFLRSGRIEVRRYEKAFLHGKAFIIDEDEGVISGSSNFTAAGLTSNLELNLGRYDPTPVRRVRTWFDELWEAASPYDLAAIYEERFQEFEPYLVYLRVLWERYGEDLEKEAEETSKSKIRLTTFQNDGIFRALRIAEQYHGVLFCDGVGLGKSFVAGELIRRTVEEKRQRALLIAPAALRDGTWDRFQAGHNLYFECISYEQLANDRQLGGHESYLKARPNEYSLVVVDEAQAFRNPETRRAQALRRLLEGKPPKTLVFLTATPVNNSLWDLYYLLTYFIKHDAAFSDMGVRSLKDRFVTSSHEDPEDLRPDTLFDILDATTVRRTRHFVRRYYPNDRVPGPNGQDIPVEFPEPHVKAINYSLDRVLPGFFSEFEAALAPEEGEPQLTLARYAPGRYRRGGQADPREAALLGLLRSGLLKRFESSTWAFSRTAMKMVEANNRFLDGLRNGVILSGDALAEWEATDADDAYDELIESGAAEPAEGYDLKALRADVERDRDLLLSFASRAEKVIPTDDPKLRRLEEALVEILRQADEEALGEEDRRNKRKVIVFSYFADTVHWITRFLKDRLDSDRRLAAYRGRLVTVVGGGDTEDGVNREDAVFGFAPISSEAPPGRDEDLYDILVTTDVLAEGVNLQQARHIISVDLPWNPMRLVQRHGRVDRIGSPHKDVYLRCFFPDQRLDQLLELEARIRRKLAQAAVTIGAENEVIPGGAYSEQVFTETRDEIEALRRENPEIFVNGGEDPTAHSGEEYRQELRKGLELYGDRVRSLPGGAGSGFVGGAETGHFFCARVGDRVFLRFVPFGGGPVVRDTLGCLRLISCRRDTARAVSQGMMEGSYEAWDVARKDIFEEWSFSTDPANLQPKVRQPLKDAADQLRRFPPPGVVQDELDRLIDALEAPWGLRIEKAIRDARGDKSGAAASTAIADAIRALGLQPYSPPEPLPPIDEKEVLLVCWMATQAAEKDSPGRA